MTEEIREKISAGLFEFSKHAVDQTIVRRITVQDLREAIARGEIIEDYRMINTDLARIIHDRNSQQWEQIQSAQRTA